MRASSTSRASCLTSSASDLLGISAERSVRASLHVCSLGRPVEPGTTEDDVLDIE